MKSITYHWVNRSYQFPIPPPSIILRAISSIMYIFSNEVYFHTIYTHRANIPKSNSVVVMRSGDPRIGSEKAMPLL